MRMNTVHVNVQVAPGMHGRRLCERGDIDGGVSLAPRCQPGCAGGGGGVAGGRPLRCRLAGLQGEDRVGQVVAEPLWHQQDVGGCWRRVRRLSVSDCTRLQ